MSRNLMISFSKEKMRKLMQINMRLFKLIRDLVKKTLREEFQMRDLKK